MHNFRCRSCGRFTKRNSNGQKWCRLCAKINIAANHHAAKIRSGRLTDHGHRGSGNGSWKGGISHKWAKHYKKDACENCGTKKNLQIHHKDKDSTNNTPKNLSTLCVPCHVELHCQEVQVCTRCGMKFVGHSRAKRCVPCRKKYKREYDLQYYRDYDRTKPKGERKNAT